MARVVVRTRFAVSLAGVGPGAIAQDAESSDLVGNHGFVDGTVDDGVDQGGAEPLRRSGHLEIEAGVRGRGGAVSAEPVRDDEAVEPPLVPEDRREKPLVLAAVGTVEPVVGAHDSPGPGFGDRGFEGNEVQLAQRRVVDVRADGHTFELGVVRHEVLDRGAHADRLHAPDEADGEPRREVRVLGVALEVAAGQRMAMQVHRRREEHVGALGP